MRACWRKRKLIRSSGRLSPAWGRPNAQRIWNAGYGGIKLTLKMPPALKFEAGEGEQFLIVDGKCIGLAPQRAADLREVIIQRGKVRRAERALEALVDAQDKHELRETTGQPFDLPEADAIKPPDAAPMHDDWLALTLRINKLDQLIFVAYCLLGAMGATLIKMHMM